MHIKVQTLTGRSSLINIESNANIATLSELVEECMSVPVSEQKLFFSGKLLVEGTVADYGIMEEAAIHLLVCIDGGKGKKKKKKVKKNKKSHKKRKVKLAVLGYFKVENGNVVRLRQRSPTGTFMAEHSDRYYCGRSHITYVKKEVTEKPKAKVAETKVVVEEAKPEKGGKKGKK